MRRAKRMSVMIMATALVTILLASSLPAGAQTGQEPCPEGTFRGDIVGVGFYCYAIPAPVFCPEGFVEVPVYTEIIGVDFVCELPPPDSGDGGSGGSGGGGGSGGDGSGGSGSGVVPVNQDGQQDSEAGEIEQTFNVSHTPN